MNYLQIRSKIGGEPPKEKNQQELIGVHAPGLLRPRNALPTSFIDCSSIDRKKYIYRARVFSPSANMKINKKKKRSKEKSSKIKVLVREERSERPSASARVYTPNKNISHRAAILSFSLPLVCSYFCCFSRGRCTNR